MRLLSDHIILDHPRVCGEKSIVMMFSVHHLGSPPRVRGKAIVLISSSRENGITPACAGKRFRDDMDKGKSEDHPRVCGEKMYSWVQVL